MGKLQQQQEVEEFAQLKSTPTSYTTNPKASRFKRVCVFCGSSSGNGTVYSNVALNLGRELVRFFMISISQLTVAVVTMAVSICVIKHSAEPQPQIFRHNLGSHKYWCLQDKMHTSSNDFDESSSTARCRRGTN